LCSKAYSRKNETPISTAAIPTRFNQCEPMRDSRSSEAARGAVCEDEGNLGCGVGGVGGDGRESDWIFVVRVKEGSRRSSEMGVGA